MSARSGIFLRKPGARNVVRVVIAVATLKSVMFVLRAAHPVIMIVVPHVMLDFFWGIFQHVFYAGMPVQHAVITSPVICALMSTVQVATIRHVYNVKLAIILLERAVNPAGKVVTAVTIIKPVHLVSRDVQFATTTAAPHVTEAIFSRLCPTSFHALLFLMVE